jgi:hypothetical protein
MKAGFAALMMLEGRRMTSGQQEPANRGKSAGVDAAARQSIERGLQFLASRQNDDGAFGRDGYRRNAAVVSLAGLAFMANGSTPGRGPFGRQINRCVNFILANSQDSGFIFAAAGSGYGPMYGHGFATLFLAEVYGMWPDDEVRNKLKKAVRLIVNTQNDEGGWRYRPERRDADISVTICQVMGLRAARNAGIYVSNDTIDRCTDYVKRCQNPDGGFSYQLPNGESRFPRTAAGIVALYSAGIYEGDEVTRGLEYMMQHLPRSDAPSLENHFFYGHYYAAQAMWQAGGDYWQRWYPAIRRVLLARQKDDGSWFDQICPEYGTAMACLVLQMPNNFLPIFQR